MKSTSVLVGAALAAATTLPAFAARIGDAAAPLAITEWVKGKAVDVKNGQNICVVEFWATWCGPCRVSIPHLTKLQKRFKDKGVVVVGISDETADKVKPFVEQQAEKMDYVVAIDDARKSNKGYMEAYGQNGIPHAFIVGKDGKVLWHGHPMAGLDQALEDMLAGKYDLQSAIKKDEARAARDEFQQLSRKGDPKAKELGRKLLADKGNDAGALCDFAMSIAADTRNKNRDFALAEEALTKAEQVAGAKSAQVLGVRAIVLFENGKQDEGLKLVKEAIGLAKDDKEKARYENYQRVMTARRDGPKKAAKESK
jgi:thiol-disulfide isomerase/thioredoxin